MPLYAATNEVVSSKTVHKVDDGDEDEENPDDVPTAGASSAEPSSFLHCETVGGKTVAFTSVSVEPGCRPNCNCFE